MLTEEGLPLMGITFSKAPVNEVVAGLVFVARADLLAPHFGEFWVSYLKREYPRVGHALPVASPGEPPFSDPLTGLPLPRLWFIGEEQSRMIQLQQDRIYANWRRLSASDEYVRFPAVRDEFNRVYSLFNQYVESTTGISIKPVRYELTYVNMLRQGDEYSEVTDLEEIFRDFGWSKTDRFLSKPLKLSAKYEFSLPDGLGSLGVSADPVRNNETGENMFRLQLAAVAPTNVVGEVSFGKWIEAAHEQIVRGFKDMTSDRMHEHWGLMPGEAST